MAFILDREPWMARRNSMPFRCTASAYRWDKVGAFLRYLARKLLKLPLCRYVDDFFGVESKRNVQHALDCFTRLTRALLGATSLADDKGEHGMPLVVV